MSVSATPFAVGGARPLLVVRGKANALSLPLRYGQGAALVTPSSGTATITGPDDTTLSTGAVTISASTASYTWTPAADLDLGAGYTVAWVLTVDGQTVDVRQAGYVVRWVPAQTVSDRDLYLRAPDLEARVPARQCPAPRGDGSGWQPQIDEAYFGLLQRMIDDGGRPWAVRDILGVREYLIAASIAVCWRTVPPGAVGSGVESAQRGADAQAARALAALRYQYDDDNADARTSATPPIRLGPAYRASRW